MPTDQERDPVAIRISHKLDGLPASISFNNWLLGVSDPLHNHDKPTRVAIGPRYRGEREPQEMEKHKLKYLKQLLERLRENAVDKYVVELRGLEQRAWEFHQLDDQTTSFSRDEFVEMLLLDGCFIIELFRRYKNKDKQQQEEDPDLLMAKDESQVSLRRELRRDLILVENQIPFFIIDHLFKKTRLRSEHNDDIIRWALGFLRCAVPNQRLEVVNDGTEVKHLLGLVHRSWGYQFTRALNNNLPGDADKKWGFVDSATELQEVGVEFQMARTNLFDVQFNNGIMEIPRLTIKGYIEFPFRNMVLYEQRHLESDQRKYVSDYVAFINFLVNSPRDVQLLRHRNIIESPIANDTTVCNLLKDLYRLVQNSSENFSYSHVCLDVNRHCRQRKNAWIAKLEFAACLVIFLTIVQTVFSVLSYFKGG